MKSDLNKIAEPDAEKIEFSVLFKGFVYHKISHQGIFLLDFIVEFGVDLGKFFEIDVSGDLNPTAIITYSRADKHEIEGKPLPEYKLVTQLNPDVEDVKIPFYGSGTVDGGVHHVNAV